MQQILESYLRRLTNLTGNNRSLLLLRSSSDQFIDLHEFDYALNAPSFNIISQLIARKDNIRLCKIMDARDAGSNNLSKKLKRLDRIERFIFEERGARDLYVGWPFVRGKFSDGTLVRGPLMFFPVALKHDDQQKEWVLQLRENVNLTLNKSFLLAYAYFNQVKVDENLLERVFDDFDRDSRVFRTELYELFKNSNIEINFNQENFVDALTAFRAFKKADLEAMEQPGELKLYPEAILGIFPQAGSYLVPDYVRLLESPTIGKIEDFFSSRTSDKEEADLSHHSEAYRYLDRVKEEQTFTPFKMDAFQENAIKAVKKGNSVVVQGPPGTGKSQLISNLIADFIARGKTVLLVSQKRAALDVVYNRLDVKGIAEFIGLMHDFKNDRKSIYEQIATQIEKLHEYQNFNNSLDSIHLERNFQKVSRRIDQISEDMEEFKYWLYDDSEAGKSVKELYLTSDLNLPGINIKEEYREFRFGEIDEFLRNLKYYAGFSLKFDKDDYLWRDRKSFSHFGINELQELKRVIREVPAYQKLVYDETKKLMGDGLDLDTAEVWLNRKKSLNEFLALLKDKIAYENFLHMIDYSDQETNSLWLSNVERTIMDCYSGVGPEVSIPTSELGRFQEALEEALDARKNVFRWIRWRFFSKKKMLVTRVLVANNLKSNRRGFRVLTDRVDNRLNLEHNLTKLRASTWVKNPPDSYQKIDIQNWFYYKRRALNAKIIYNDVRNFKEYFNVKMMTYQELKDKLIALFELLNDFPKLKMEWLGFLSSFQITLLLKDPENLDQIDKTLDRDFDSLVAYDQLKESLSVAENAVVSKLLDVVNPLSEERFITIFLNSLSLAWIDHIEAKYPVLRAVSSTIWESWEEELQDAVAEKLQISKEILLMKARERTYQNLEYNRLNNLVTYRDLVHQVTKKRRIWPVRKLIANFPREVFDLIPCWMASPEAASAIFPMEEIFDLVIFDEASQCFAERGIPAMYRGKQVVITGDDKQLTPNDLYQVRWEDDNDDDIPELEIDSLLNLAKQHLMEVQLRRHYRSKSLDLIDFSNRIFYKNKLRLLPDFEDMRRNEPGIRYVKVEGIWQDNSNVVEAIEVVRQVFQLMESHPDKSIGVVTFNVKQQGLILDELEQHATAHRLTLPDHLFVKNIENVQGDERDIIIFSTGYAPDKNGKMNMKFGSLNAEGGENRLNVAVTRARERILMVSSIHPEQLHVADTRNEGPKLLKRYLQYALEVSEGRFKVETNLEERFRPSWYLKHLLLGMKMPELSSFQMVEELPFTDLTIKSDGAYQALVLTDDDLYFNSISIKEAHVFRPFAMKEKNWKYRGFYSRQFWMNKEETRERLMKFLASNGVALNPGNNNN